MSVLVYVEAVNGGVAKNAHEAVSYAKKIADGLGTTVTAVIAGNASGLENLGANGASKVLHAKGDTFSSFDPKVMTKVVVTAAEAEGSDVIIFSHDFAGKSIASRVAARLNAGSVTGAVDYPNTSGGFSVKKAVFSGKAFAEVEITTPKKVISLLPNSVPVTTGSGSAQVSDLSVDISGSSSVIVKEIKTSGGNTVSLPEAEIVVSAGRGLKGPENWGMIEEMAKKLGAATACSRPVADMHWRPHHEHVGQTGVAIRPNLYFAIGISGAIQHLAGVNGSKVIVVINNDPEAPFFKAADYGIVGDAFEVVPKLNAAIDKFNASK